MSTKDQETIEVPTWFQSAFEPMGSEFIGEGNEVGAETPWGSTYIPKRYDEMPAQQREQADTMIKRWEDDENFVKTTSANGQEVYTDTHTGFSVNTSQLMLTGGADGQYEVASMFDIGMFTGAVAESKAQLDIQKAMLGIDEGKTNAEAMTETDTSNDTSMIGKPGAPIAGPVVAGALPEVDPKEYDVKGMSKVMPQVQKQVTDYLASKGLKEGDPDYEANFNAASAKLIDQLKPQFALNKDTQNPNDPNEPEEKPKHSATNAARDVHWMDRTGYKKGKDEVYERNFTNDGEVGSNNYGDYRSDDDFYESFDKTLEGLLESGSKTALKEAGEWKANAERYHNLGIATESDKAAYESDMNIQEAKRKSMNTAAGRKMEADAQDANTLREAYDHLDKALENPENNALESVKLSRKQARLAKGAQKEDLPKHHREATDAIGKKVRATKRIKNLLGLGDASKLEKVKPADRAKQFLSGFFGANKEEMNTKLAKMGMDELVSRTIKEISGAAASDQERAYITKWMLGGEGMDANVLKSILNNIEFNAYDEAKALGEKLYTDGRISTLQSLSNSTKHLHGMKLEDVVIEADTETKPKIKRTHGARR